MINTLELLKELIGAGKVTPNQVSYGEDFINVAGIRFKSTFPRSDFAKVLSMFPFKEPNIIIGKNTYIHPTATIGGNGFGYVSPPVANDSTLLIDIKHHGGVVIGDNVYIGERVNIHRGVVHDTFIGEGTKIDYGVHIAHGVSVGSHNTIAALCSFEGSVTIGNRNTFGSGVIVQRGITISNYNIFGSGSVVTKFEYDYGEHKVYVGNPAKYLRNV